MDELLEQWRRERPELDVRALGVVSRLFRAAELADRRLERPLSELGLQPGWLDVLAALRRAGAPFELNPSQLLRATLLSSGGMTKRIDRLVEAGLVERRQDPADRRGTLVALTSRGKELVDRAIEGHVANEEALLRNLTSAERRALDDLLRKLLNDLEAGQTPS